MSNVTNAATKAVVGGSGATVATSEPSEYVSYFDRVYDVGLFLISGDDAARVIGAGVGLLVAFNIVYTIVKDYKSKSEWK